MKISAATPIQGACISLSGPEVYRLNASLHDLRRVISDVYFDGPLQKLSKLLEHVVESNAYYPNKEI